MYYTKDETDLKGKELEEDWLRFIGDAAPAGSAADVVGIDMIVKLDDDKFLPVQIKSSAYHALGHVENGRRYNRLIPVIVGYPCLGAKKECLKALAEKGVWIAPELRNYMIASELEAAYAKYQTLVVRACDKRTARNLCMLDNAQY